MSAASFLHSSFLQAISDVMLWPVRVEKIPQASEHLCPAQLQARCDICCACQSICTFIPTDSGVPRTVDPHIWPVHVQKVPQASEHLCPAQLQTRCDICCACQPVCPFIGSAFSQWKTKQCKQQEQDSKNKPNRF